MDEPVYKISTKKQVDAKHYDLKKYVSKKRWNSFYHQIKEIVSLSPNSVLEVGVGANVVGIMLKNIIHCNYEVMDVDAELKPDHIGSILDMPFPDKKYDVIGCFQVLEHLPYDNFAKALSELFRVAKKAVIISLPDAGRVIKLHIPKICSRKLIRWPFTRLEEHEFNGQHYWEINKKGSEIKKIIETINEIGEKFDFSLKKEYRLWEQPYHHFFILKKI
jgi:ubiquinone/menaquinone biosynthesis C-methylase UbiE